MRAPLFFAVGPWAAAFDDVGVDLGHAGEKGELGGRVVGSDVLAEVEQFAVALVAGFVGVELEPPEECGGVLEELVIESVLGSWRGELVEPEEVGAVAALEG